MKDINLFKFEGSVYLKKVKSKSEISKDDKCDGYLIESSEKEARRIVESLKVNDEGKIVEGGGKKFLIGVGGGDDAFNRRVVESLRVDYLVSPERGFKKDSLKQRDSGLNHVVAKIARDKGILIVVNFNEVSKLSSKDDSAEPKGKELALRLGRLVQNVRVCRKAGCGVRIGSFGLKEGEVFGEKERRAFGESLGMSSKQSVESVRF